jgi:hypothetical protein
MADTTEARAWLRENLAELEIWFQLIVASAAFYRS